MWGRLKFTWFHFRVMVKTDQDREIVTYANTLMTVAAN